MAGLPAGRIKLDKQSRRFSQAITNAFDTLFTGTDMEIVAGKLVIKLAVPSGLERAAGGLTIQLSTPAHGKHLALANDGLYVLDSYLFNTGDTCTGTLIVEGDIQSPKGDGTTTTEGFGIGTIPSAATGEGNLAVGAGAGAGLTSGAECTFVGVRAGDAVTTDVGATAFGYQALSGLTDQAGSTAFGWSCFTTGTGRNNTGVGYRVGFDATSGHNHTLVGCRAGENITTSNNNVAVGSFAMNANKTSSQNTAMGSLALLSHTSGDNNTALGNSAMQDDVSGVGNIAIGAFALSNNISGIYNTAIGVSSLLFCTTGTYNIGIGRSALGSAIDTQANIGIGRNAATAVEHSSFVVAIGSQALESLIEGENNFAMGFFAMQSTVYGSSNMALGVRALRDLNPTGATITAFADAGGGQITVTSNGHGRSNGEDVIIRGTTNYDDSYTISNVATNTFEITDTWVATDTGHWWLADEGSVNVAIGYQAGMTNVTGFGNIFIGFEAGRDELGSNKLYIANSATATPLIWGDFGTSSIEFNGTITKEVFITNSAGHICAILDAGISTLFSLDDNGLGSMIGFHLDTATFGVVDMCTASWGIRSTKDIIIDKDGALLRIGADAAFWTIQQETSGDDLEIMRGAGTGQITLGKQTEVQGNFFVTGGYLDARDWMGITKGSTDPVAVPACLYRGEAGNFQNSDVLGLRNPNVDGEVIICANTSTASTPGEVEVCRFKDDQLLISQPILLQGNAAVLKTTDLEISSLKRPATNQPALDDVDGFDMLRFDRTTEEWVFSHWEVPGDYLDAGVIHIHFDFIIRNPPVGADEAVVMGIEYKKLANTDVFSFTAGTTTATITEVIVDGETADVIHAIAEIDLTTTGFTHTDVILFRFFRDATNGADTYDNEASAADNDVWLYNIHIEYQIDGLGEPL